MRGLKSALLLALVFSVTAFAAGRDLQAHRIAFDIREQPLGTALTAFARQASVQILKRDEEVSLAGLIAPAVSGEMSAKEALEKLLANSGLTYLFVNEKTVRVGVAANKEAGTGKGRDSEWVLAQANASAADSDVLAAGQAPGGGQTTANATGGPENKIEEIVVTAQKRGEERLQDVPIPITAISTDKLVDRNLLRLQDYYTSVPGFVVSPSASNGGQQVLSLRGISMGWNSKPTVGITVDDMPYGSSGGAGVWIPDFDPSDLGRIEVLRGPQGTLYGSSSMGGLVRYVTVDPSTESLSGRVQVGASGVQNGDELGYNVRGAINVPLGDTFAIRASGFTRQDPGYIDNVVTGIDGVNRTRATGGRLSALWRPSDTFSLRLSALHQDFKRDGSETVTVRPGFGELEQNWIRGAGVSDRTVQAYGANLTLKLGSVDLTAISGYNINEFRDSIDSCDQYCAIGFNQVFPINGNPSGLENTAHVKLERFTQELRLSMPIGQRLTTQIGGFYSREKSPFYDFAIRAADPATGALVGTIIGLGIGKRVGSSDEYAAFANLSVQVTDRIDVQVGARQVELRATSSSGYLEGALFGGVRTESPPGPPLKDDAFTYLFTPRFKVTEDLMVYGRLASGFRPGGGTSSPRPTDLCVLISVPCLINPDETMNYEIGVKGNMLDSRLSYDISMYYIDWKDIQVTLSGAVFAFGANAGEGKSQGIEFSVEGRPRSGLTIGASGAWSEAKLTKDPPSGFTFGGGKGDTLPYNARFVGQLSLDQEFPLGTSMTGFAGATLSYVGDRPGNFILTAVPRTEYPAYTRLDLHTGLQRDAWTANLFINNITDKRVPIGGGLSTDSEFGFVFLQPRTLGVSLLRTF